MICQSLVAQDNIQGNQKEITVKWIEEEIELDGALNEASWSTAEVASEFWQHFPTDTLLSSSQTEIKMLFDKKYLYVGIKVYLQGDDYVVPSLKRDFRARGNDNITMMFDTYRDGTNAFMFGTNPEGVQREALISGGGNSFKDFRSTWDVKWENISKVYDGYYIAEMKIPLASFKFRDQETQWRFTSYRFDTQSNQWSTWANTPQNQIVMNLAFMGLMTFEKPLDKVKTQFAVIPYVSGNVSQEFDPSSTSTDFSIGGDAKIPIGNSLNLDLTVNPDFSQVEVDELVINLTRFEAFLPEKRQFFIDNADLFSDFGNATSANPFFSRRIGIAKDLDDNNIENSIIAGARLSGKLNKNLRIGVLNIQTAEDAANEIPTNNNTVVALQQKVFKRSNIGFIFVNRQVTKMTDFVEDAEEFNRVLGLDFNLRSEDNKWTGKYYLHKSFTPESGNKDLSSGGFLEYNTRDWKFNIGGIYVGDDFQSDLGFIRRNDIVTINPVATRIFYPAGSKINTHTIEVRGSTTWSPDLDFKYTDGMVDVEYQIAFRNQSQIEMALNHRYTYLLDDFDPTGSDDGIPLPAFSKYNYTKLDFTYQSDNRKDFLYEVRTDLGEFFNGYKYSLTSDFRYRVQPYFTASFRSSFNYIDLPDPYPTESVWFVGPKVEFTFTKNLFWSTFIQFNSLDEDFSINSRLQWRFRPLSDLYVVYNDNYKTTPFSPGYRALIVKFTYWINI
ncbi:MAG: carbohydrate binding family 9 domain-containing protein [Flavobacteriales bacterium]|nr:carbohydrate binding family 9 domain-containing protein [Flavobacteriales bacterium]